MSVISQKLKRQQKVKFISFSPSGAFQGHHSTQVTQFSATFNLYLPGFTNDFFLFFFLPFFFPIPSRLGIFQALELSNRTRLTKIHNFSLVHESQLRFKSYRNAQNKASISFPLHLNYLITVNSWEVRKLRWYSPGLPVVLCWVWPRLLNVSWGPCQQESA